MRFSRQSVRLRIDAPVCNSKHTQTGAKIERWVCSNKINFEAKKTALWFCCDKTCAGEEEQTHEAAEAVWPMVSLGCNTQSIIMTPRVASAAANFGHILQQKTHDRPSGRCQVAIKLWWHYKPPLCFDKCNIHGCIYRLMESTTVSVWVDNGKCLRVHGQKRGGSYQSTPSRLLKPDVTVSVTCHQRFKAKGLYFDSLRLIFSKHGQSDRQNIERLQSKTWSI